MVDLNVRKFGLTSNQPLVFRMQGGSSDSASLQPVLIFTDPKEKLAAFSGSDSMVRHDDYDTKFNYGLTRSKANLPNLRRLFVDARTEAEESSYSRNAV